MPIINIITWPTEQATKERVMQEITRVVHEITHAPLDKISVIFQEVEKNSWSEAGVLGSDKRFAEDSRRQKY